MTVEIICVGTEILMGNIVNTNAAYLAQQCASLGLALYHQTVVGDNPMRLKDAIDIAIKRSDILIFSGGLGPTQDDLTKETVANAFHLPMVFDPKAFELLEQSFQRFKKPMTENNKKQANVPKGSIVLYNRCGTAPGIIIEDSSCTAILLPGPPNELIPMFSEQVFPYLRTKTNQSLYSKMVKIIGVGESAVETIILDLIEGQTNPTIATYAKTGEVHVRITALATNIEEAMTFISPIITIFQERFGNHIFAYDEEVTLEDALVLRLKELEATVTFAESCTGGLLSGRFVNASGASAVYQEGFITYSNEAKVDLLKVSEQTIAQYGVVSEEVAKEMAVGSRERANSTFSVSITGIAGPDGGSKEKPVGTVCIACASSSEVIAHRYQFTGTREKIREASVTRALSLLWDLLGGHHH